MLCLHGPVTHQLSLEKEVMSLMPGARDLIFTGNPPLLSRCKKKRALLKINRRYKRYIKNSISIKICKNANVSVK